MDIKKLHLQLFSRFFALHDTVFSRLPSLSSHALNLIPGTSTSSRSQGTTIDRLFEILTNLWTFRIIACAFCGRLRHDTAALQPQSVVQSAASQRFCMRMHLRAPSRGIPTYLAYSSSSSSSGSCSCCCSSIDLDGNSSRGLGWRWWRLLAVVWLAGRPGEDVCGCGSLEAWSLM